MLILHPAFHLPYILPIDPLIGLSPNKPLTRTVSFESVSDFVPSHSVMSRDPDESRTVFRKTYSVDFQLEIDLFLQN